MTRRLLVALVAWWYRRRQQRRIAVYLKGRPRTTIVGPGVSVSEKGTGS